MMQSRTRLAGCLAAAGLVLGGCTNSVSGVPSGGAATGATGASTGGTGASAGGTGGTGASVGGTNAGGSGSTASGGSGNGSSSGGSSSGGASGTSGTSGTSGSGPGEPVYLPAGVRRLTNQEYRASVQDLLGDVLPADIAFPPDARQDGFTRNRAQRVDPVLAKQLDAAAMAIADGARSTFSTLTGCPDETADEACADAFILGWGKKAYRRELTSEEEAGLLELYRTGVTGGSHADGIALVIRAMLQAAGFLYITELGDGTAPSGEAFTLTARELAVSLAYYLTGEPPSAALLADADAGSVTVTADDVSTKHVASAAGTAFDFSTPEALGVWARRLIHGDGEGAKNALAGMIREWIGVDRISETGKDSSAYPDFDDDYRTSLERETREFVQQIKLEGGGVEALLGADWTMANAKLAGEKYYGLSAFPGSESGFVKVMLTEQPRRGILNQGAFLSVFAHASESAPILRGVAVLERVLCYDPGSPADLSDVDPPAPPNPDQTTRQRYDTHSGRPKCAGCHAPIDAIGFAFESFDGAGKFRTTEGQNQLPVDSTTSVDVGLELGLAGDFADSAALVAELAKTPTARACFARHLFRSASTLSGDTVKGSEDSFVGEWSVDAEAATGKFVESFVAYAKSPIFAHRRAP